MNSVVSLQIHSLALARISLGACWVKLCRLFDSNISFAVKVTIHVAHRLARRANRTVISRMFGDLPVCVAARTTVAIR
jgi:hypothetical protein